LPEAVKQLADLPDLRVAQSAHVFRQRREMQRIEQLLVVAVPFVDRPLVARSSIINRPLL
jgi:hypothetical protein